MLLKRLEREKRNIYFIAVLIMCTMVSIGTLTFRNMYFEKTRKKHNQRSAISQYYSWT